MRRIKQLLTMRFGAGASTREIARELGVAPSTVREYLSRAAAAGVGWPLAADVTDESLMARLGHRLHQPQHLDELALAAVPHARLEKMAQVLEQPNQWPDFTPPASAKRRRSNGLVCHRHAHFLTAAGTRSTEAG
jgi:AcrR family transcriptional regulator